MIKKIRQEYYPDKYFTYMGENQDLDIRVGDEVYWNDPDEGICSGYYKVSEVLGDVFRLTNDSGAELEAFRHELS